MFSKSMFKKKYLEHIAIFLIFIFSFSIFKLIFEKTANGSFYQGIIAALIGTLLTVTITSLLLKKQTKSTEIKEQNIEVFKKKVERFERVTQLLGLTLEDNKITEEEAKRIKEAIYDLALFSSEKTIEVVSKFLRHKIIGDHENGEETTFFHVISQFRKDLNIENINDFSVNDIASIDSLLNIGFDQVHIYNKIYKYLGALKLSIDSKLKKDFNKSEYQKFSIKGIESAYDWIEFTVENEESILMYVISITYPNKPEIQELHIEVAAFDLFKLTEMEKEGRLFKSEREKIHELSSQIGFKYVELNTNNEFAPHYYKKYPINYKQKTAKNFRIIGKSQFKEILDDIYALEFRRVDETSCASNTK